MVAQRAARRRLAAAHSAVSNVATTNSTARCARQAFSRVTRHLHSPRKLSCSSGIHGRELGITARRAPARSRRHGQSSYRGRQPCRQGASPSNSNSAELRCGSGSGWQSLRPCAAPRSRPPLAGAGSPCRSLAASAWSHSRHRVANLHDIDVHGHWCFDSQRVSGWPRWAARRVPGLRPERPGRDGRLSLR
jgi:hypothetical protein